MPAWKATSSTKSKTKEDISHKIQEIKQRQQNWLKQRDKQHEESNEKSNTSVASASKLADVNLNSLQIGLQNSSIVTKKVNSDKNHVCEKFKQWIDARNPSKVHDESASDFNDCNSIHSGAESELERLVSPDQYMIMQPVSEQEFGNLADKIAKKVKEDLGLQQLNSSTAGNILKNERCKTFVKEIPTFHQNGASSLSSHNCTVCREAMLTSKNIPTMVIPCGHTFCKSCLDGKQACPSCDCQVTSLTVNIMLQQVIQEYHSNHVPLESLETIGSSEASKYFQAKYFEDNQGNHKTSYQTQLENLETRHNILFTEHKMLVSKQKQMTNQLLQEQKQTQNIARQEEEVEKAILELQDRLVALREHRKQYEFQIMTLKDEKSKLEGKINLLSATIDSIARDIEKVKLLSESEFTNIC